MSNLAHRDFSFNNHVVTVDVTWLPHIRVSTDKGQSWQSGTDMEFLADVMGVQPNRVQELTVVFKQWADANEGK
jgi:hypothetical protein